MFLDGDGGELVEEDADQAGVGSVEVVARRARGQAEQELAEERRHRHGAAVERQAGAASGSTKTLYGPRREGDAAAPRRPDPGRVPARHRLIDGAYRRGRSAEGYSRTRPSRRRPTA
jgi:hypothetical protein